MNKITSKIEQKFKNSHISMKSKYYFIVTYIFYILVVLAIVLFSLFLASFIIFSIRHSGINYLLDFGFRGLISYIRTIPWLLIIILLALILLIEFFSHKIDLVSKKPLIYSFITVLLIIYISGITLANSNIHHQFLSQAVESHLPLGNEIYKKYGTFDQDNFFIVKIDKVSDARLEVCADQEKYYVDLNENTKTPPLDRLSEGSYIIIYGELKNDSIRAIEIRPLNGPKPKLRGHKSIFKPSTQHEYNLQTL